MHACSILRAHAAIRRKLHDRCPAAASAEMAAANAGRVPHVRRLWLGHEHRRLVEPFCGGLAVALGLMPRRALLNDVNAHLINSTGISNVASSSACRWRTTARRTTRTARF